MSEDTRRGPESLPESGTGRSAAGLAEGFARDGLVNGSVFLSLVVVVAGFVVPGTASTVLGLVIGVPGVVLPWLAVGRKWSISTAWLIVGGVMAADLAALTLMWTTA